MDEIIELRQAMNEIKERVTRIEERSSNRDEKIGAMANKVDEMHQFFLQTQGGAKTASAMAKIAYGAGGVIFAFVFQNWQAIKRIF